MGNVRIPAGGIEVDGVSFPPGVLKMDDPYWEKALIAKGAKPTASEPGAPDDAVIEIPAPDTEVLNATALRAKPVEALRDIAAERGIAIARDDGSAVPKKDLVDAILTSEPLDQAARASEEAGQIERTADFQAAAEAGETGAMTTADLPSGHH